MGLFGAGRTTVGLDIGSGFVKLAEVGHGGDRPELRQVAAVPTPAGAIVDGEITNPGLVADAVRQLVEEAGLGMRDVVAALGGHHVFIKRLRLPRSKAREARDAVRREAERHVPFDIAGVQLDFQMLDPRGDGPHMEVLLVAAKRRRVEERITLLQDAGIGSVLLDVEALALCNAFAHNYPSTSQGLVAVVDCGHETTGINVLQDGIPIAANDHHFGLGQLTESMVGDRALPAEHAKDVAEGRLEPSLPNPVLEEAAGQIASGLERAGAMLRTRFPGIGMGRVYLGGGGACVPELAATVGRRIKVETRVAHPFEKVAVRTDPAAQALLARSAPLFLLTVGLALRTG
ncbi:MAG: type IV pilus assembly protein PilM [Gemmatimonadetes bacterium]|nr:type IV pilus assembly protein PilM [Gemmatimonadota bacterium]MYI06985.1 type IV pilus assembly protein PilM [Gemmatimonadota bacterium]